MYARFRPKFVRSLAAAAVLAAAIAGGSTVWAGQTQTAPAASKSLYDRIGGAPAVAAVVDDLLARAGADARIARYFTGTDLAGLKGHLVNLICQITGGPCVYAGRDMKTAHQGLGISSADYNALMEDLLASLEKQKVSKEDAAAVVGALLPMKKDIVEKP